MATLRRVTVATTATLIAAADGNRKALLIVNRGPTTVYLGNDTAVSAADGPITLGAGEALEDSVTPTQIIYAIVAVGTQVLEVSES